MNRTERAKSDLEEKIKLEKKLAAAINVFFMTVASDFKKSLLDDGAIQDFSNYINQLETILDDHYQLTSKVFSRRLRDQLGISLSEDETNILNDALLAYFLVEKAEVAKEINATSLEQAKLSVDKTLAQQTIDIASGLSSYTQSFFALVATQAFRNYLQNRVERIAITETNKVAEAAKEAEFRVAQYLKPDLLSPVVTTPFSDEDTGTGDWTSILDDRTRRTHVAADGQKRKYGQPFIVGGYKLRRPGDRSLGAPTKETIHCRCGVIWTLPRKILNLRS